MNGLLGLGRSERSDFSFVIFVVWEGVWLFIFLFVFICMGGCVMFCSQ